jgi:hypothetical protein
MSRLDAIYPAAAQEAIVVPGFPIPRFPDAAQARNLTSARAFYGERLVAEYEVDGCADRVGVVDKLFPHSRFDSMLLVTNDEIRTASTDLAPSTAAVLFWLAHRFVDYISEPEVTRKFRLDGAEIHVCFNFDRDTTDRDNAMFYDKRFHLHLNCWPGYDLSGIVGVPFSSLGDRVLRRRIIDPVAGLAAQVLRDAIGSAIEGHRLLVSPAELPGAPVGLAIRLPGWSALSDGTVPTIARQLHEAAEDAYRQVREALIGDSGPIQPRIRPALLPLARSRAQLARLSWLSTSSRDGLLQLASLLEPLCEAEVAARCDDPIRSEAELTLAGLDYTIGIYCPRSHSPEQPLARAAEVILTMQCRLFGDIGGAGLPPLRGAAAVRLDRQSGPQLTVEQISERDSFRDGFIGYGLAKAIMNGALRPVPRTPMLPSTRLAR